jgi:Arc/MetJ-type ribon-helix-helix transcriptional regulator
MLIAVEMSLNVPGEEVAFIDRQVRAGYYRSRLAAMGAALKLWRKSELESGYLEAFENSDPIWDRSIADGLAEAKNEGS